MCRMYVDTLFICHGEDVEGLQLRKSSQNDENRE